MKNIYEMFKDVSDEELLETYKDILGSKELGIQCNSLKKYAKQVKEIYYFETLSLALDFTVEIFYKEIAARYFRNFIMD